MKANMHLVAPVHIQGCRVELIHTNDPCARIRPGARGHVSVVDSAETVHIRWDDGSNLGLNEEAGDRWRYLKEGE